MELTTHSGPSFSHQVHGSSILLILGPPDANQEGVLTIRGNVYTAYTCEEQSFKITEAIDLSVWMAETVSQVAQSSSDQLKLPEQQTPRKNIKSKEHKEVQLVDGDPKKTALIRANLDAK